MEVIVKGDGISYFMLGGKGFFLGVKGIRNKLVFNLLRDSN